MNHKKQFKQNVSLTNIAPETTPTSITSSSVDSVNDNYFDAVVMVMIVMMMMMMMMMMMTVRMMN